MQRVVLFMSFALALAVVSGCGTREPVRLHGQPKTMAVGAAEGGPGRCQAQLYGLGAQEGYDHLRYAPASIERAYDGGAFFASVDSYDDDNADGAPDYLAQPNWVASHVKEYRTPEGDLNPRQLERPSPWYRTQVFDEEREFYGTNKRMDDSYTGVGRVWNRGHLAKRSDGSRLGPEFGCDTHVFANAVPQHASFNQGIWLGLENTASSLANQHGEVWVVTGPIYKAGAEIEYIGDVEDGEIPVAIPDALFKVIFIESGDYVDIYSFVYPNKYEALPALYKSGNCSRDQLYDHSKFLVSLVDVERATGLVFFPKEEGEDSSFKHEIPGEVPPVRPEFAVGDCL